MQEYFIDQRIQPGDVIELPKDKAHHAFRVLKLNHETVRLVSGHQGYFAHVYQEDGKGLARIESIDPDRNELNTKITLAMALIRREKFELVLQKATELGVAAIVPFYSSRCVVKAKEEKAEKQKERWQAILTEASEQCKRDEIPAISSPVAFQKLSSVSSSVRLCAYEAAGQKAKQIKDFLPCDSITVVIGPEGGFSKEEIAFLRENDFSCITLGNRILRAETAAMFACSVIGEISK